MDYMYEIDQNPWSFSFRNWTLLTTEQKQTDYALA